MRRHVAQWLSILPVLMLWASTGFAAPRCPEIEQFLTGKATGVVCFHSDDLRTNNILLLRETTRSPPSPTERHFQDCSGASTPLRRSPIER